MRWRAVRQPGILQKFSAPIRWDNSMCGWKVLIWNRNYSRTTTYRVNLCIMDLFCGPAAWGPVSRKMDNPIGCGPGSGINKKGGVGGQSLSRHGSRLLPTHHSEALCGTAPYQDLWGPQCQYSLVFEKLQDDGRALTLLPRGGTKWWIQTDAAIATVQVVRGWKSSAKREAVGKTLQHKPKDIEDSRSLVKENLATMSRVIVQWRF